MGCTGSITNSGAVAMSSASHTLKGSSATICAENLSSACALLEKRERSTDLSDVEPLIDEVEIELNNMFDEIRQALA